MSISMSQLVKAVVLQKPQPRTMQRRRLQISRADLATALSLAGPGASLPTVVWLHARTALRLARAGVRYLCQGQAVSATYGRMTTTEFQHINARQAWANWRIIPRNLSGHLPIDRPLAVLDLCCGTGESTRALAWWLPRGSHLLGLELDPRFAAIAAERTYVTREQEEVSATICCGSVLEPFPDGSGASLGDATLDLVHASGSIGCHFPPAQSRSIVRECARVLKDDGLALLDSGSHGTTAAELAAIAREYGLIEIGRSRSWWFDRYRQLVLRKSGR